MPPETIIIGELPCHVCGFPIISEACSILVNDISLGEVATFVHKRCVTEDVNLHNVNVITYKEWVEEKTDATGN